MLEIGSESGWQSNYVEQLVHECSDAKNLLQQLSTQSGVPEKELFDKITALLNDSTDHSYKTSHPFYALAYVSITTYRVAENLLKLMQLYEHSPSNFAGQLLNKVYNWFTFSKQEEDITPCMNTVKSPLDRERYVVCQHMKHFFAESIGSAIQKSCISYGDGLFNFEHEITHFKNFGSYLIAAECPLPTNTQLPVSSAHLRTYWDKNYKENYCVKFDPSSLPSLCTEKNSNQSLGFAHWRKVIYPRSRSNNIYNSKVLSEIEENLQERAQLRRDWYTLASFIKRNYTEILERQIERLEAKHESSIVMSRLIQHKTTLKKQYTAFTQHKSADKWQQLQDLVATIREFIDQHKLNDMFPDLEQLMETIDEIEKPQKHMDL